MQSAILRASAHVFLLAAISVLSTSVAEAVDPYDINVIQALTGQASFMGHGQNQALRLAETVVNQSGGIRGRPVRFVFHDDQSNPQVTVQLANEVLAEKPAVLLGSSLTASCRAIAPLMKDGPVEYCFSPGIHPDPGSYLFSSSVSTVDLANALVRYFRLKGWTRIALMFSTDATGQDAETALDRILALPDNKAMQVVEVEHFNITDVSVSAQIEKIKAAAPQCFIAWASGAPIGTIFNAMIQTGLVVPTGTTDGNMTHAQMEQYAKIMPNELYIPAGQWVVRDPALLAPGVAEKHREFYDAFEAAGLRPEEGNQAAWDPAMLLIGALRALGPEASAAQVRRHLATLHDFPGINGNYDFVKVPQRGLDATNAVVTRWSAQAGTWQVMSRTTGVPLP